MANLGLLARLRSIGHARGDDRGAARAVSGGRPLSRILLRAASLVVDLGGPSSTRRYLHRRKARL